MRLILRNTTGGTALGLAGLMILASLDASASSRHDEGIGFYVGYDALATIASGTYASLSNPNADRLTLLLDHGNHFHGIGTYGYAGPAGAPEILSTNSNNRIPEISSREDPLPLTAGSGLYGGTLRSGVGDSEYSYLGIASIQSLAGHVPGGVEDVLFHSSSNRWSGTLDGAQIALRLVNSTPGLHIGTEAIRDAYSGSDVFALGTGNDFEFKPIYWVDADAAAGVYSATFELLNTSAESPLLSSGTFSFDFAVSPVPEPETYAMFTAGLFLLTWGARRRARR
ncbi:all3515 family Zur-repressed PEP-CTERM protein [Nitrosovibrio sp. Nv17]|uniref:all3515 family Zur-repressed PEP-CTERM protein n=1 Tax=Nitrosovibrio sp. Nv17 TaxID=1855339 RepID=UPI00090878F0|nr:all3515 family Zur-repressed PEP-CTERM protein [Nitrosovibrio sp. Nv17]SFW32583.1 PEP-CTERM protein-sorting domain-containing protein [Nitrosovibrio sp. Nv17]